jgi:hypothetical protein
MSVFVLYAVAVLATFSAVVVAAMKDARLARIAVHAKTARPVGIAQ